MTLMVTAHAQTIESAQSFWKACQDNLNARDYQQFIICFDENDRAQMNYALSLISGMALMSNKADPMVMQELEEVYARYPEKEIGDVEVNSPADVSRVLRMVNTDEGIFAKTVVIMKVMDSIAELGGGFKPYSDFIDGVGNAQLSDWTEVEHGVTALSSRETFNFQWDGSSWSLTGVWKLQPGQ